MTDRFTDRRLDSVVRQLRPPERELAVPIAMKWLAERHQKGWRVAFDNWLRQAGVEFDDDWDPDDDFMHMLTVNVGEWLLARGEIFARREMRNINGYLLGRDGPYFTPIQRAWLEQLARQPLCLWRVTEVREGEGLTLVDAIDANSLPVRVQERSGSRTATPGMLLGARVMEVDQHHELSGAIYPFSKLHEAQVISAVQAVADSREREWAIAHHWVKQHIEPPPLPELRHAASGEPMLLITDHYRVRDAEALARALATQPDVAGDAQQGWRRQVTGDDGAVRSLLNVNPGKEPDRIELFFQTQRLADEGRAWFDALAGDAVQYLTREITDPRGALGKRGAGAAKAPKLASPDLPPEVMTQLMQQALHRIYAKWADEPIPLLGNQTPRQAIATPAGLERVKGLLREYEANEARMSRDDGRAPASLQFLWDSLALAR